MKTLSVAVRRETLKTASNRHYEVSHSRERVGQALEARLSLWIHPAHAGGTDSFPANAIVDKPQARGVRITPKLITSFRGD